MYFLKFNKNISKNNKKVLTNKKICSILYSVEIQIPTYRFGVYRISMSSPPQAGKTYGSLFSFFLEKLSSERPANTAFIVFSNGPQSVSERVPDYEKRSFHKIYQNSHKGCDSPLCGIIVRHALGCEILCMECIHLRG